MSENDKKGKNNNDNLLKFFTGLGIMAIGFGKVCHRGFRIINWKNPKVHFFLMFWFIFSAILVLWKFAHLRFLNFIAGDLFTPSVCQWFASLGPWINTLFLFCGGSSLILFILGIVDFASLKKYQEAINEANIRNSKGLVPKVQKAIKLDEDRTLLKVTSPGMAPSSWESKKDDLAFSFREIIDDIKPSKNKEFVEIYLSKNDLPDFVSYKKYEEEIVEPFSFIVGESKNEGLISQSIRSCPHMLIGGVSGYGKSTAFKLMLYSILKNTPPEQIKMSLLDLKRGIEVTDFQDFPNITISKTEQDAVNELEEIVKEMNDRYDYLEKIKKKNLDPIRDNKPIILVAVDEASVIFGTRSRCSSKKVLVDQAREMCEEIAKLGRASGIHMILATQKATNTSIDARTAENLEARLCFRARSVSGSNAILGHKGGVELPETKGRAIWQKGGVDVKVQVPFIEEKDLENRCRQLCEEYSRALPAPNSASSKSNEDAQSEPLTQIAS